jgi:hypothetical protein
VIAEQVVASTNLEQPLHGARVLFLELLGESEIATERDRLSQGGRGRDGIGGDRRSGWVLTATKSPGWIRSASTKSSSDTYSR